MRRVLLRGSQLPARPALPHHPHLSHQQTAAGPAHRPHHQLQPGGQALPGAQGRGVRQGAEEVLLLTLVTKYNNNIEL